MIVVIDLPCAPVQHADRIFIKIPAKKRTKNGCKHSALQKPFDPIIRQTIMHNYQQSESQTQA